MEGLGTICVLGIVVICGLGLTGADYAEFEGFIREQANNESFVRLYEEHVKMFKDRNMNLKGTFEFNCLTYPKPKAEPTSVHELTPMDITVVAAMGDSITAGTGITAGTVLGLLRQDRQLSWSIGGESNIFEEKTLPNILRFYNPNITGYSVGYGSVDSESKSRFNVANPGDKSEAMPGQAVLLVERMNEDKTVDMATDWKMITLFVGVKYKAENYVTNLQTALDYLQENVPRAFVSLVQVLNIGIVRTLNQGLICDALHIYGCPCAAFPRSSEAERELEEETDLYRKLTEELILSGRYDTTDDFTVVLQPFFTQTQPPNKTGTDDPDFSYFAPDCFHLSLKGHRAACEALWDNLVEPVGKKRTSWTPKETIQCPSESNPYFYTYKNSDQSYSQPSNNQDTLGAVNGQDLSVEMTSSDNSKYKGQSVSMTTVAIVTGAVVSTVFLVGLLLMKRKRRHTEEREVLLHTDSLRIYTA